LKGITYFEWLTLLSFLYFREKKADIAVLEAGLGGRLDAVNTADPLLTVITPISHEHTRILGRTLARIAWEKSFLIHRGGRLVMARQEKSARKVLLARCRQFKAPVLEEGKDFSCRVVSKNAVFNVGRRRFILRLDGKPLYGAEDFALALQALAVLKDVFGFDKIHFQKACRVFQRFLWPGRFETVSKKPLVLVDGAHNPASAKRLAESVRFHFPGKRVALILGTAEDKDTAGIARELMRIKPFRVVAAPFAGPRALSARALKERSGTALAPVLPSRNLKEAFRSVLKVCGPKDVILVTGSLYLAAEARRIYGKDSS
jgi:dihydrofolate synthase/folylpolyglutamate synthase